MALTSRGKALVAGGAVVAVLGGGMAALALSGNAPAPIQDALGGLGVPDPVEPCPLTGETLPGDEAPPERPVLAVKVENTPDAQPLAGLQGPTSSTRKSSRAASPGSSRCSTATSPNRIGPVRSVRTTDPKILAPFSEHPCSPSPAGRTACSRSVDDSGLTTIDEGNAAKASPETSGGSRRTTCSRRRRRSGPRGRVAKGEPTPGPPFRTSTIGAEAEQADRRGHGSLLGPRDRGVAVGEGPAGSATWTGRP